MEHGLFWNAGVIPIDRLTDVRAPVEAVAQRVGRQQLERVYGLRLPQPARGDDVNRQGWI
jgi:large subunit GTPase 1